MPDSLQQLYQNSKEIKAENQAQYEQTLNEASTGNFLPKDYKPAPIVAPDFSGKSPSPYGSTMDYEGYIKDPSSLGEYSDPNLLRAEGQTGLQQFGSLAARVIPGTILGAVGNLAAIGDVPHYVHSDDEVTNGITNTMNSWMDSVNKWAPIYQKHPGQSFDIGDPGWWYGNGSNMLNMALAFGATSMITGGIAGAVGESIAGASKIAQMINAGADLSKAGEIFETLSPVAQKAINYSASKNIASVVSKLGRSLTSDEVAIVFGNSAANYANGVNMLVGTPLNAIATNQAFSIQSATGIYKNVIDQKVAEGDDLETAKRKASDAAAVTTNLNRANLALNLVSAGIFANSGSIIAKAMGGIKNTVIGESAMAGAEMGMFHANDQEGMQKAKDGDNYEFDINRYIGHLATPEGLESMTMGAAMGLGTAGLQGGAGLFKEHVVPKYNETLDNIKNATKKVVDKISGKPTADTEESAVEEPVKATQATTTTLAQPESENINPPVGEEYIHDKHELVDQYLKDKQNASTPIEHSRIDDEFLKTIVPNIIAKEGDSSLDVDHDGQPINVFRSALEASANVDVNKELELRKAKDPSTSIEEVKMDKANAEKALSRVDDIIMAAKSLPKEVMKFPNANEIISKQVDLDDAIVARVDAESALSKAKAYISDTPTLDKESIDEILRLPQKDYDEAVSNHEKLIADKTGLISTSTQNYQRELADLAEKNKSTANSNEKINNITRNIPKTSLDSESIILSNGNKLTKNNSISSVDQSPHVLELEDNSNIGDKYGVPNNGDLKSITPEQYNDLSNNNTNMTIVKGKNNDAYLLTPPKYTADNVLIVNPTIKKLLNGVDKPNGDGTIIPGQPSITTGTRDAFDAEAGGKLTIGDKTFGVDDIGGISFTKQQLTDFLTTKLPSPADSNINEYNKIDIKEPEISNDNNISGIERLIESGTDASEYSGQQVFDPSTTAYLAVQYVKDVEGIDKVFINTGIVNGEYSINSDGSKVFIGANIVIEPYTGKKIPTNNYDSQGNSKWKSGVRETEDHNAQSALEAGREIPIAIYIKNSDGTKTLSSFLREDAWLNEGLQKKDGKLFGERINLASPTSREDYEYQRDRVEQVSKLRQYITDEYRKGDKVSIESKITDVSNGHPFTDDTGSAKELSHKDRLPHLLEDVNNNSEGHSPFAYVVGDTVFHGDSPVQILNSEQFQNAKNINGYPIVLLPRVGTGMFYAMLAKSKKLNEVGREIISNPGEDLEYDKPSQEEYIRHGILAFMGINGKGEVSDIASNAYNDHVMNNLGKTYNEKSKINDPSGKGLITYIKSFIHLDLSRTFNETSSDIEKSGIYIDYRSKDGISPVINYGLYGKGSTIIHDDLGQLKKDLLSTDVNKRNDAETQLTSLVSFIGRLKHTFDDSKIDSNIPFVGISENGIDVIAKSYKERYMDTLTTTAKTAGKSDGKNIYLVQPTIGFDSKLPEAKGENVEQLNILKDEKSGNEKTIPSPTSDEEKRRQESVLNSQKPGEAQATTIKKERIIRSKRSVDGNGANIPDAKQSIGLESTDILPSISVESKKDILNSDNGYIVKTSDDKVLSTEEQNAGVGAILINFANHFNSGDQEISVMDVFNDAKATLSEKYNQYIDQSAVEGLAQLEIDKLDKNLDGIDKILDPDAWNKIQQMALDRMNQMGIKVTGSDKSTDEFLSRSIRDEDGSTNDSSGKIESDTGGLYGEDWNNHALFSTGNMDTASRAVKMMMWSLTDLSKSSLGMASVVDVEEAFRRVLGITSLAKDKSPIGLISAIDNEAKILEDDGKFQNNIYRQLHDKLTAIDVDGNQNLQTQIQFYSAMDRHRNSFVKNVWNNAFGKLYTFTSDRKNADKVVLGEWNSFISYSLLSSGDKQSTFANAIKPLKNAKALIIDHLNTPIDKRTDLNLIEAQIKRHIAESFDALGIKLNDATYATLSGGKEVYNSKNGYTFKGNESLLKQFDGTGNNPLGIFSALISAYGKIENGMDIETALSTVNQSAFKFLTKLESKNSDKYFANVSKGIDGNSRYNYGLPTAQTIIEHKLLNDSIFLRAMAGTTPDNGATFSRFASWLSRDKLNSPIVPSTGIPAGNSFRDVFQIGYKDGIMKGGTSKSSPRDEMVLSEDLLSRITDFQNNGKYDTFLWDSTKADKCNQPVFHINREVLDDGLFIIGDDGKVSINKDKLANSEIMKKAIGVIRGEGDRIFKLMNMDDTTRDELTKKHGENFYNNGQFFYNYDFLNELFKFDDVKDKSGKIIGIKIDPDANVGGVEIEPGKFEGGFKTSDLVSMTKQEHLQFFNDKIADYYISKVASDIKLFEDNGLITRKSDGSLNKIPVNTDYAKVWGFSGKEDKSVPQVSKERALQHVMLDWELNSQIALHNSMMIISGDPALMGKPVLSNILDYRKSMVKDKIADTKNLSIRLGMGKAMEDYQKRLASDIAPFVKVAADVTLSDGTSLSKTYNTAFTKDMQFDASEYVKSLPKGSGLIGSSIKIKGTDAAEFITVPHKLELLLRDGQINESDFLRLNKIYNSGNDFSDEDLNKFMIAAPGKPVQVPSKFTNICDIIFPKRVYVKSAELPLVKQITRTINGPYDALRQAMEDKGIDRLTHLSAAKYGAENVIDVYDGKNIKSLDEMKLMMNDNVSQMPWDGFGYQQEIPFDEHHDSVSLVTQANALLFDGIQDLKFDYKDRNGDNKISGSDLLERKHSIRNALSDIEVDDINNELGYNSSNGTLNDNSISNSLEKSASTLGWPQSDVNAVKLSISNNIPRLFTAIAPRFESVMNSKFSNRVIKQKQPGGSNVQMVNVGKGWDNASKEYINNINGVIKTKDYNADLGLRYSKSENGDTHYMEVIMPFKFWSQMGDLLDAKDFSKDGLIDFDKLPEDLLKIIGMRIPNQSHSSQALAKIVGFLPKGAGDTILVPPEITLQMGSDFDVDKLYTYWRNSFHTSEGKLVILPKDAVYFNKDHSVSIDDGKLKRWRYDNFNDQFANRARLFDKINNIKEADTLIAEALKSREEWPEEISNKVNSIMNSEISDSEARSIAMEEIGITDQDMNVPSIKLLRKKALQDAYFEMFESVLQHPDVIKKAMTPLDKPDLQNLANEVKSYSPKRQWSDPLRQAQDYLANQGARMGISLSSRIVTAFASYEKKNIGFIKYDNSGNKIKDNFSKFKNNSGDILRLNMLNPLAKSTYIDNSKKPHDRSAMENQVTQQSGFVDNANKPVTSPNNINSNTYNVSAVISALADDSANGLSLTTNARFLRQESIKMLSDQLDNANSTLATFQEASNRSVSDAINVIKKQLTKRVDSSIGIRTLDEELAWIKDKAYSPNDLTNYEKMAIGDKRNSAEYIAAQIDFLDMFKELNDRGQLFSDATSMSSINSKGLGINYFENQVILNKASRAIESGRLDNIDKLWSRDGTARISLDRLTNEYRFNYDPSDKLTESGNNIKNTINWQNAMMKQMGYDNPLFQSVIARIEGIKGFSKNSVTPAMAKSRKNIADSYKSFVYSKMESLKNDSWDSLVENGAVAKQLIDLKHDPELQNNLFVQSLQTDNSLRYIHMDARTTDGSSSDSVIRGFYELATSDNPKYSDFADNVIKVQYLSGGVQSIDSPLKYIGTDILDKLGYNRDISNVLSGNIVPSEHTNELTQKFFQNKPDESSFIKGALKHITPEKYLSFDLDSDSKKFVGDDIANRIITTDEDMNTVYKQYFRTYDADFKTRLFKLNNDGVRDANGDIIGNMIRYDEIPLVGYAKVINERSAYDPNVPMFTDYSKPYAEEATAGLGAIQNIANLTSKYDKVEEPIDIIKKNIPHQSNISDIAEFMKKSENQGIVFTGHMIDQLKDKMNIVGIEYSDKPLRDNAVAQYDYIDDKITINNAKLRDGIKQYGENYAYEIINHEINHAIQHEAYISGAQGDPKYKGIYDNTNAIFNDAKENIKDLPIISLTTGKPILDLKYSDFIDEINRSYNKIETINDIANRLYPNVVDSELRNEIRTSLYHLSSPEEFMADLSSKPKLQQFMNRIMISDKTADSLNIEKNRSILQSFLGGFAKLFSKLIGDKVNDLKYEEITPKSILEASYINSMMLLDKSVEPGKFLAEEKSNDKIQQSIGLEKYQKEDTNKPKLRTDIGFRTFDLGEYTGTEQSKDKIDEVNNRIINNPNDPIAKGGESFNNFSTNVLNSAKKMINEAPTNSVIVTHNTAFGLIRLWDKMNRPDELNEKFRKIYVKQDSETGALFKIEGKNGDIWVVRHGETDDNVAGNFRSNDTHLTINGVKQASELADKIPTPSEIVSSNLPRAIRTANIIANAHIRVDLDTTISDYLRKTDKGNIFAFKDAISKGIFRTKCN